ncbi:MAG: methyltransferase domain-containing protein [Sandaracinaceae bacterium]
MRDCDRDRLPARLRDRFVPLEPDPVVEAFETASRPHGALRATAQRWLRRSITDFDADAILGTHPMAMLGPASWEALVGRGGRLLDVGAGSGDITAHAVGLLDAIETTELSWPLVLRLRARGFTCHRVDLAGGAHLGTFDVVSALNVLDRTSRPRTLLAAMRAHLAPDGRLLLSVPLPARPHVDVGGATIDPDEPLHADGDTFEAALATLALRMIEPAGLTVERLARAPYLSRGSEDTPLYVLDAAIVVARRS